MKIKEIFDLSIKLGIKSDFRSEKEIQEYLNQQKKQYLALAEKEKKYFDKDALSNPYIDSRIHYIANDKPIKKVLAGIDISIGSLLLAKDLGVDLIINHHPVGKALASLDGVMDMQIDLLEKEGVPINIAEKLIQLRISEVTRGLSPVNHYVLVDAAKLLGINLINVHTPADNLVYQYVKNKIEKAKPKYIYEILESLLEIPEYSEAKKMGFGPILFTGNGKNRCGKIAFTEITGGTSGSKDIYQAMANAGIGTIIGMHQSEEHRKNAETAHVNVVIAGHISSDSIGMNLFLDELENKGIKIMPFGGLIRFSRLKK